MKDCLTRRTGFSVFIEPWTTKERWRQRMRSSSARRGLLHRHARAAEIEKTALPPTTCSGGLIAPPIALTSVDLPQLDSPAMP